MAVDVIYSENSLTLISPRISFSNDHVEDQDETTNFPCRLDHTLVDSTFDFAFNVDSSISFESSTADMLFSNGKILPTSLKKEEDKKEIKIIPVQVQTEELLIPCLDPHPAKKKSLKEFLEDGLDEEDEEAKTTFRSFWKFGRSKSLNCERNYQRKGFIGSSKTLSRSKSTGKFLEKIHEEEDGVEIEKSNRKLTFWIFSRSSSLNSDHANINGHGKTIDGWSNSKPFRRSSSLNCDTRIGANQGLIGSHKFLPRSYSTGSAKKKQQKSVPITAKSSPNKGYSYGNYNNVRVSPLLNLPSPYISRVSVDLFGFGSLFCNGNTKDRKRRK